MLRQLSESTIFAFQIAKVIQTIKITSDSHCTIYEVVELILAGIIVFVFVLLAPIKNKAQASSP